MIAVPPWFRPIYQPWHGGDLEPALSAATLENHLVLHRGYAAKEARGQASAFDRGGAFLHNLYWASLYPPGGSPPTGPLKRVLGCGEGGWVDLLTNAVVSMQGSGWVALVAIDGQLTLRIVPNHDLRALADCVPLLVLDAWEHAYFLDYRPAEEGGGLVAKGAYAAAIMDLLDWSGASERYAAGLTISPRA